jgi:hypothetical protein
MVLPEDQLTLYHIINRIQRRQKKLITGIIDKEGVKQTTPKDIRKTFYSELKARFAKIEVQEDSLEKICSDITHRIQDEEKGHMDQTITYAELAETTKQAPKRKSPGEDRIAAELYECRREIMSDDMTQLYNNFFHSGTVLSIQTRGIIVCLPKHNEPERVKDDRPLTLLNADHKIYTRILANRLKPTLKDIIHDNQYSAVPGRNIIDATTALRDIIAAAIGTQRAICLMVLDFKRAFDKISHTYLHRQFRQYNYGDKLQKAIKSLYTNAQPTITINGRYASDIPIQCSIRQACPLGSILYALILNPFIILVNKHLQGLNIGNDNRRVACIAYADDVTVIITGQQDVKKLSRILQIYEQATGAMVNWDKTCALPIGRWD